MKTLTVKVPEALDIKLTAVAKKRNESKSALLRAALEHIVASGDEIASSSCLDLAKDLVGSVDGPADLSTNRDYKEGYGK